MSKQIENTYKYWISVLLNMPIFTFCNFSTSEQWLSSDPPLDVSDNSL